MKIYLILLIISIKSIVFQNNNVDECLSQSNNFLEFYKQIKYIEKPTKKFNCITANKRLKIFLENIHLVYKDLENNYKSFLNRENQKVDFKKAHYYRWMCQLSIRMFDPFINNLTEKNYPVLLQVIFEKIKVFEIVLKQMESNNAYCIYNAISHDFTATKDFLLSSIAYFYGKKIIFYESYLLTIDSLYIDFYLFENLEYLKNNELKEVVENYYGRKLECYTASYDCILDEFWLISLTDTFIE